MDAVIFDFDGTILDTEWPAYVTVAEAFAHHGGEISLEAWQHRIGRGDNAPWTDLLVDQVGPLDVDAIQASRRARKNALTDEQPIRRGVEAMIAAATAASIRLGVASSSPLDWVGPHLERLALMSHFHGVRTFDDVENAKPWPDVFLAAADAIGADPTRCIAIEDSVHGVTAAKAAGMFCVAVPNRITAGGDFGHADVVADSLADVDLHSLL